jgi:glycosyltransferase involved in cell wall biosynthesis
MGRYYRAINSIVDLVAISHAQRALAHDLSWAGAVHNAVRVDDFPFREDKAGFALFLGRLSPDKGLVIAIDAATRAGVDLVIAAKAKEPAEQDYFEAEIKPRLGGHIHWVGEADRSTKFELLTAARCLLFPICWEEPFGMVMIEALACGTPVVTTPAGAAPEIVADGVTGYVRSGDMALVEALGRVPSIDRAACRRAVETRFSVERMVRDHVNLYEAVAGSPASCVRDRAG